MKKNKDISKLDEVVQVWHCSFSKNEANLHVFERLLSEDEIRKASNFKFTKDKNTFIISRGIVRELLGAYLSLNPKEIKFEYSSFGKPFLSNNNLKFNISHSGDIGVFGFVHHLELGVDVEQIKTDFDVLDLAKNFFSKHEISVMEKMPEEALPRAFYRCWTRKEAFIKAEGSGLSFPLDQFTVSIEKDDQANLLKTDWDASEKDKWSLTSFVPNEEYIGAIALRKKIATIEYFEWDPMMADKR